MDSLLEFMNTHSHLGVLLALLAAGLGAPVPEDIILVTGGVIAARTQTLFWTNILCLFGVLFGDLIIYTAGYHYGEGLLKRWPFRWLVSARRLRQVRHYYRKYGYWAIFISRFLAGLRATSFLLAGLSHVPLRIFLLADGVAALLSVPFFVILGYYFSDDIQRLMTLVRSLERGILVGVGALIALLVGFIIWRRRRGEEDGAGDDDSHEDSHDDRAQSGP